jgi:hypothetical protein
LGQFEGRSDPLDCVRGRCLGLAKFKIPILYLGVVGLPDYRAMPFRHLRPGRFDLDTLKLMQQAFDTVCAKLQIDESDTRRVTLANEIIRLAEEGKRETLAEQAEEALALAMPPLAKRIVSYFKTGE